MEKSNKLPLPLRWWGLLMGGVTLFWLPDEDTNLVWLVIVSTGWCLWWAGWLRFRLMKRLDSAWRRVLITGVGGVSLFPVALMLVVFKAGLHRHGFLDFSNLQLLRILELTPFWGGGGLLLGILLEMIQGYWFYGESSNR